MGKSIFECVVVPVADEDDARTTCLALAPYLDAESRVVALHVIEKAGGAPDKASVEQRQEGATKIFDVVQDTLADATVETDLRYGTDIADTIFAAAADVDASSIAFSPRGGSRWVRLLTGDVALSLVTETDRPVVVLPDAPDE
ncbi:MULTISPECIES: universal stress protein [unclassified Haladaptatus]|uniref:universal stress protein n=1 Tax=unclassified Haladaptatus TaxID=2622732 RepID=UPI0023E7EC75|nr:MULTISPECIES: universal stress protein [unclassified Haladaptatus]